MQQLYGLCISGKRGSKCRFLYNFAVFLFQITLQRLDHGQGQPQILRELWVWNNAVIWQFVMPMPDIEIMESSLYL